MKPDALDFNQTSLSFNTQSKPIHELECEGDTRGELQLGTGRFTNNNNNKEMQYQRVRNHSQETEALNLQINKPYL